MSLIFTSGRKPITITVFLLGLLFLASCATQKPASYGAQKTFPDKGVGFFQIDYAYLPGWKDEVPEGAFNAFGQSCTRLLKRPRNEAIGNRFIDLRAGDFHSPCKKLSRYPAKQAGEFFQKNFVPFHVQSREGSLFTGYYEASIDAHYERTDLFRYPVYATPKNLTKPYFTRQQIDEGALRGKADILFWARDSIDIFTLHVQGSGVATFTDGQKIRIGYAENNGHNYQSIGRVLIRKGLIERNKASWQNMRRWIEQNPDQKNALLWHNPRYIFFKANYGKNAPTGTEGVPLTPLHSLAVDTRFVPLSLPLWVDIEKGALKSVRHIRGIMVAQDTGNAIRGAIRGDVFWGEGKEAAQKAGKMRNRGRYYLLLPQKAARRFIAQAQ